MLKVIKRHADQYPQMQPIDVVKLIYQNEFGPGHFVENEFLSMQRLKKECSELQHVRGRYVEKIGNGLCRYWLYGMDEWEQAILNRIFVYSANHRKGSIEQYEGKMKAVGQILEELPFCFSKEEYEACIRNQKESGYPAVSHSEGFRNTYRPTYRVIEEKFVPFLPILAEIEKLQQEKENPVIGIDGNAAAGKTTLADCIACLYDCDMIHMDEFFLPANLRSRERLMEVGGNIHYERFRDEVIEGIRKKEAFSYRSFSCHRMDYVGEKTISNRKMLIVEGSYAMREDFRDIYDYKIFLTLPEKLQKDRILTRNGEQMYGMFRDKWIPMENRYFEEGRVKENCDYCYRWEEKVDSIFFE